MRWYRESRSRKSVVRTRGVLRTSWTERLARSSYGGWKRRHDYWCRKSVSQGATLAMFFNPKLLTGSGMHQYFRIIQGGQNSRS